MSISEIKGVRLGERVQYDRKKRPPSGCGHETQVLGAPSYVIANSPGFSLSALEIMSQQGAHPICHFDKAAQISVGPALGPVHIRTHQPETGRKDTRYPIHSQREMQAICGASLAP